MSEKIGIRPATIVIQENKILLVHSKYNDKEFFLFPGGGMEFGETIEQTAIRETLEETGVKVKIKDIFHINEYINNKDWNERSISIFFLAEIEKIGKPLTNDNGKIKEIKWIEIDKLDNYNIKPKRVVSILKDYLENKSNTLYSIDFKE